MQYFSSADEPWNQRDSRALAAVFFAGLALRIAFVLAIRPTPVSDPRWYLGRAIGIVHGAGYSVGGHPTAFWPPGWPYFLAGVIRIAGPSPFAAEIAQALLNALTVAIVFLIGRRIFGRGPAIAGAIAYAVLPSAVEWSSVLVSEPLYTLLWALATYIWVRRPTQQLGWYALSGVILGAAALVRPSALLFWVILLVYLLTLKTERRYPGRLAAAVAVTAFFTFAVVTPVIVRDYGVYHRVIIISNNGGVSLYQANNPIAGGGYTELVNPEIIKLINDPRTEADGDALASRLAIAYIEQHPLHELWLAVRKVKALYQGDDDVIRFSLRADHFREMPSPPPQDHVAVALLLLNRAVYYVLMLFALAGIIICFRTPALLDERHPQWRLLLGLILYNTAIFAVIGGLDRYRYPTMPYFAAFAGLGIVAASRISAKRAAHA